MVLAMRKSHYYWRRWPVLQQFWQALPHRRRRPSHPARQPATRSGLLFGPAAARRRPHPGPVCDLFHIQPRAGGALPYPKASPGWHLPGDLTCQIEESWPRRPCGSIPGRPSPRARSTGATMARRRGNWRRTTGGRSKNQSIIRVFRFWGRQVHRLAWETGPQRRKSVRICRPARNSPWPQPAFFCFASFLRCNTSIWPSRKSNTRWNIPWGICSLRETPTKEKTSA